MLFRQAACVGEYRVVSVVSKIIEIIQSPVRGRLKRQQLAEYMNSLPYEKRVEDVGAYNGPVLVPTEKAMPSELPESNNSDKITAEQISRALDTIKTRCFHEGQRVRISTFGYAGMRGETGTVVEAGPTAAYVTVDRLAKNGDHEPVRFSARELVPVRANAHEHFQSSRNP